MKNHFRVQGIVFIIGIIVACFIFTVYLIPIDKFPYFFSWDTFVTAFNESVLHIYDTGDPVA